MIKLLALLFLVCSVTVAKPSFNDIEDEFIEQLARQDVEQPLKDDKDVEEEQPAFKAQSDQAKDPPLFANFFHYLLKISVRKVKPDEHPDLKYRKPGEELVKKLLVVREAVIDTFQPFYKIGMLMVEDHKEMMKRITRAVQRNNIYKAKHVVGEYFIALNRRFLWFFYLADKRGLFREIGKSKKNDAVENFKREFEKQADEARKAVEFILYHFNEHRVSDGLLDKPFVKLGVQTAIAYFHAFKQGQKVGIMAWNYYIDMVSDIVRLALKERKHEAAVQRAGASVLSMIRRGTKTVVALHHLYTKKKCYGPRSDEDEELLDEIEKPEEKKAAKA